MIVAHMCWHATLNAIEVSDHPRDRTVVDNIALRHHQKLVNGCQDSVAGLVNGQENRALPRRRHLREDLHDMEGGGAVQA